MTFGDVVPVDLGGAPVDRHHRRVASVVFNESFAKDGVKCALDKVRAVFRKRIADNEVCVGDRHGLKWGRGVNYYLLYGFNFNFYTNKKKLHDYLITNPNAFTIVSNKKQILINRFSKLTFIASGKVLFRF